MTNLYLIDDTDDIDDNYDKKATTRCMICNNELIWNGDHDLTMKSDEYSLQSNYSCPECGLYLEAYVPKSSV